MIQYRIVILYEWLKASPMFMNLHQEYFNGNMKVGFVLYQFIITHRLGVQCSGLICFKEFTNFFKNSDVFVGVGANLTGTNQLN